MKRIVAVSVFLLLLGFNAVAQETPQKPETKPQETGQKPEAKPEATAPEALPTVDQIVDKFVEAMGGKAALEKLTSQVAKGTFEIPAFNASGTFESYAKAPNKRINIIDVPNFGVIRQAFDGTVAWEDNPQVGLTEKSGTALLRAKLDSEFYRDIKLKELYPKMSVKGKEKVGEADTYLVEATPEGLSSEKWYFDATTGLLVRADQEREGPNGTSMVQTYLEDYRAVDGVKIPHSVRQVAPDFSLSLKFTEVKHNVDVEDSKFAKPAPAK